MSSPQTLSNENVEYSLSWLRSWACLWRYSSVTHFLRWWWYTTAWPEVDPTTSPDRLHSFSRSWATANQWLCRLLTGHPLACSSNKYVRYSCGWHITKTLVAGDWSCCVDVLIDTHNVMVWNQVRKSPQLRLCRMSIKSSSFSSCIQSENIYFFKSLSRGWSCFFFFHLSTKAASYLSFKQWFSRCLC